MDNKQLESIDSGSNYKFGDKKIYENQPRSAFDNSHLVTTTLPKAGVVYPLNWMECVPNDTHEIKVDSLLRVLPQVVPLYSRQRLYVYAIYNRFCDVWNNFHVFAKKGYSGNVIKEIPTLNDGNLISGVNLKIEPNSLGDMLGLPIGATREAIIGAHISCLPLYAHLKNWRDYWANKNYYIDDRVILPDDDSRFRCDDDGQLLSAKDLSKKVVFDIFHANACGIDYTDDNTLCVGLFFHDYPKDYFLSALPWTQRGNEEKLSINLDTSKLGVDFSNTFVSDSAAVHYESVPFNKYSVNYFDEHPTHIISNSTDEFFKQHDVLVFAEALNRGRITGSNIDVGFTLNQLRTLAVNQSELEMMARTDGSYAEFGEIFFGVKCKNTNDFRGIYVGGTYKNISFTEVLQTSETTGSGDNVKALGSYAGHGITGISDGYLGKVDCDDYGLITFYCCIMPDVYYCQGLPLKWTRSLQSDLYLPERAKLGLRPILNQELFFQGNNSADNVNGDKYLWAYNNPFDELRYSPNEIHGKIADPANLSFAPYTQARFFSELPYWGKEFARADDVRHDYLVAPSENAYTAQFHFSIRSIRPLPYKPVPAKMI